MISKTYLSSPTRETLPYTVNLGPATSALTYIAGEESLGARRVASDFLGALINLPSTVAMFLALPFGYFVQHGLTGHICDTLIIARVTLVLEVFDSD
mmetsp:Transcript_2006/g.2101  ORF Transcript_2006/g.2101 Transcript_2006/m.2101 type:complete len:97 (-) Transcript_2006:86-376(-)